MFRIEETIEFNFSFSFILLFEKNIELGHGLLRNAAYLLPQLDHVLILAQRKILSTMTDRSEPDPQLVVKTNVHVRMTSKVHDLLYRGSLFSQYFVSSSIHVLGLPTCPELHRTSFPRNRDVGSLLKVFGTITRITAPKMLEFRRQYSCGKCKKIFTIQVCH